MNPPGELPVALAVVVPTFNEQGNVTELIARLDRTLAGISWEVVFVDDDSSDLTADVLRKIGREDPRVRCIQRIGRRGLASAVLEGMLATSAPFIAVMDADLQHDETLLPRMLEILNSAEADIVIGSRLVEGGDNRSLGRWRRWASEVSSTLARALLHLDVRDLMSGYFMVRREVIDQCAKRMSGAGFKILLDIFASSPRKLRYVELPYRFRPRFSGSSKMDSNAAIALVMTVIDKKLGRIIPARLIAFMFVGGTGVLVHFAALAVALKLASIPFVYAQSIAALVAMTSNFAINNLFTYRDVRLHGWSWFKGWISFVAACSFGAVANVGVASAMFNDNFSWRLSALAGILIGTAWNFGATRIFTWKIN